jgi:hypothetical protein
LMFWFSRTATDDGVLSMSRMFGGTERSKKFVNFSTPFLSPPEEVEV